MRMEYIYIGIYIYVLKYIMECDCISNTDNRKTNKNRIQWIYDFSAKLQYNRCPLI